MKLTEKLGLWGLHKLDPETAHGVSLKLLRAGLGPQYGPVRRPRLECRMAGMGFANPIGLAAGYDKNAEAVTALSRTGFGFLEVGAATPKPQEGNPKPRLYRLTDDRAVINRFGFNNQGVDTIVARLAKARSAVPVGLNLGANKDSADRRQDYGHVLRTAAPHIDFATINISSPNTEKLRDLQGKAALEDLLGHVTAANTALDTPLPLFLKVAPDLTNGDIQDISDLCMTHELDAIIATNTTLDRDGLKDVHQGEMGGLSGAPLMEKSTRVLAKFAAATDGQMPLVGVGGVTSAADAYAKIRAGATLVQLYSAMVYQGISLVADIAKGLDSLLEADGFESVTAAVGKDVNRWL